MIEDLPIFTYFIYTCFYGQMTSAFKIDSTDIKVYLSHSPMENSRSVGQPIVTQHTSSLVFISI